MPNTSTIVKRSWIAVSGLTYIWVNISLVWDQFVNHIPMNWDWALWASLGIVSILWLFATAGIYAILNWITSE